MEDDQRCRISTKERIARQGSSDGCKPPCQASDDAPDQSEDDAQSFKRRTPDMSSRELGMRGEEAACRFLKRRGYAVFERNWTCPAGEADIIARDEDGTLVFIEVKTRSSLEAGLPCEAVTPRKRARYERIAGYFLAEYDGPECRVRFDVIAILALGNARALVRHYVNAFGSGR